MESQDQSRPQGQLRGMLRNVMRLAEFAVEKGVLPKQVELAELYVMWGKKIDRNEDLSSLEVSKLGEYNRLLEVSLSPVTAVSLAATECSGADDCMKSEAGMHARRMWKLAAFVLLMILLINLFKYTFEFMSVEWATTWPEGLTFLSFGYWVSITIAPFTYGALGAVTHVLRLTEKRLKDRTFDPRRITQHRNRLVLGTLSGGIIVMFVSSGAGEAGNVKLTAAALGFLAGYSIDFLFSILDRLLSALMPDSSSLEEAPRNENKQKMRHIENELEEIRLQGSKKTDSPKSESADIVPTKRSNSPKLSSIPNEDKAQ